MAALVSAAAGLGRFELVNNAGTLGPTPLPPIVALRSGDLERTLAVNVVAPLRVIQAALPHLRAARGAVVNVTSDAAVEGYEGWGAYGAQGRPGAAEPGAGQRGARRAGLRRRPGDMRTRMHQDAFPGEDISDRPLPGPGCPGSSGWWSGGCPAGATTWRTCRSPSTTCWRWRYEGEEQRPGCGPGPHPQRDRPGDPPAPLPRAPGHARAHVVGGGGPATVATSVRAFRIPAAGRGGRDAGGGPQGAALGSDARAGVRLMVTRRSEDRAAHRFADLGDVLEPGDVLVVNTSAVIPAALDARGPGGQAVRLHLSTEQPGGFWVVEPRLLRPGTERFRAGPHLALTLTGGGRVELLAPYPSGTGVARLWLARLDLPRPTLAHLAEHGPARPLRPRRRRG